MNPFYTQLQLAILLTISVISAQAQFTKTDIKYWVGSGPDTAILVVDFQDTIALAGGYDTVPSSIAWGYLFNTQNNITASDMLAAIDADDYHLSIDAGQFLNDIIFDVHSGLAGNPNYFSTFTKTPAIPWTSNSGIQDTLTNNMWFGCVYDPNFPAASPKNPIAALNPNHFTTTDVEYFIGTGTDTSYLTVDFMDNSMVPSFTWGYLNSGGETLADMLANIAAADVNLTVNMGNFLNSIQYGTHLDTTANTYWNIFEGNHLSVYHGSTGINANLANGKWFGCTFDINYPATAPYRTAPAIASDLFTTNDATYFVGTGTDTALFVVDFLSNGGAYAWGVLFNDTITGEEMLALIEGEDARLTSTLSSGFLSDLAYDGETGNGGNPNYWGTWTATNTGDWSGNLGLGTKITKNQWFGCSYTDFNPALRPTVPTAVTGNVNSGFSNLTPENSVTIFPNPTTGILNFNATINATVLDLTGRIVAKENYTTQLDISNLPASVYVLRITTVTGIEVVKITKQ